jgi:hypothetical protein
VKPFLEDEGGYGKSLKNLIDFLHQNSVEKFFQTLVLVNFISNGSLNMEMIPLPKWRERI